MARYKYQCPEHGDFWADYKFGHAPQTRTCLYPYWLDLMTERVEQGTLVCQEPCEEVVKKQFIPLASTGVPKDPIHEWQRKHLGD